MTFYHGTNADLEIGDILVPGEVLSVSANYGRSAHVYMTTDEFGANNDTAIREAYMWARTACMVAEDEEIEEDPCAYVYVVEPLGAVEADGGEDVGEEAVRTSTARIVGIVDGYDLLSDYPMTYGKSYIYG